MNFSEKPKLISGSAEPNTTKTGAKYSPCHTSIWKKKRILLSLILAKYGQWPPTAVILSKEGKILTSAVTLPSQSPMPQQPEQRAINPKQAGARQYPGAQVIFFPGDVKESQI